MANLWQSGEQSCHETYQNIYAYNEREKVTSVQDLMQLRNSNISTFPFQPNVQEQVSVQNSEVSVTHQFISFNCNLQRYHNPSNFSQPFQAQYIQQCSEALPYFRNINCQVDLNQQNDVMFLMTWIKTVEQQKRDKKMPRLYQPSKDIVKISDVQNAFLASNRLVMELEFISSKLTSVRNSDSEWKVLIQKAVELKLDLEEIKSFISDAISNGKIEEHIKQRRNRRRRAKIKKSQLKSKYLLQKKQWKAKEKKIDLWLQEMQDTEKNILQDKKVKESADDILHEVRTKQEEALDIKNLVEAMQNLREMRLKKGEIHGFSSRQECNETFEIIAAELRALADSQLKQYGLEEYTLQVMMENSPSVLPERILPSKRRENEEIKKEIYEVLFGKNIPFQKLSEQQKFFMASQDSLEILIKRRSSWDKYLADVDSPTSLSASVPLGWIVPPIEPSSQWEKYQICTRKINDSVLTSEISLL